MFGTTSRPRATSSSIGLLSCTVLVAAAALTGCSSGSASPGPTTGGAASAGSGAASAGTAAVSARSAGSAASEAPLTSAPAALHNQTDVTFASNMVPLGVQSLAMAAMAKNQSTDGTVKVIATRINDEGAAQLNEFSRLLMSWAQPMPAAAIAGKAMVPGSVTTAELSTLGLAKGAPFDTRWLAAMIKTDEAALALATTEATAGRNAEAKSLAATLSRTLTSDLASMKAAQATK